jgi:WD40 repeat protein
MTIPAPLPVGAVLALAVLVPCQPGHEPPQLPPAFESYVAHIAAAEGAMRHGATAAVRRWLDAVPKGERAFEWRWLDAEADQSLRALPLHDGKITCIAIAPDGRRIATGAADGGIAIWDATTLTKEVAIAGHQAAIYCVAWDAVGARLASASADRTARIWDAGSGAALAAFERHTYPVTTVRFSPDGARVASTSYQRPKGGEIRIWGAAKGEELQVLQSGYAPMTCAHWHADGSKVVGASWDQHLHVFDLAAPDEPTVTRLGPEPTYRAAQASALSPDGSLIAVGCKDDEVHLFRAWTGEHVRDLRGHAKWVESVAFSPEGTVLASGSADASVMLWDVASGERIGTLRGHRSATAANSAISRATAAGSTGCSGAATAPL